MDGTPSSTDLRIPVKDVRPDPDQPRNYFKESALKALARSIASVGQRTPIEVRRLPKGGAHQYEIIDGERRWRACQIAGITTIRACIEEAPVDRRRQHFLSLVSNFHREGHTHMEISRALARQVELGERVAVLADNLDKTDAWVYQYLSLQKLTPELQQALHPTTPDRARMRMGEALVIARAPPDLQQRLWDGILKVPTKARLERAHQLLSELTGKPREKRPPPRMDRFMSRFLTRLASDLDRVLDMKDADFTQAVRSAAALEVGPVLARLEQCSERLELLKVSLKRAAKPK